MSYLVSGVKVTLIFHFTYKALYVMQHIIKIACNRLKLLLNLVKLLHNPVKQLRVIVVCIKLITIFAARNNKSLTQL